MFLKKIKRAAEIWQSRGWRGVKIHFNRQVEKRNPAEDYQNWIQLYDTLNEADRARIRQKIEDFKHQPLISILTPVYNVDEKWLRLCLESVTNQLYENWELCLVDDASTAPHIQEILREYAARDQRIKVAFRNQNGHISAASNTALEMAAGVFCALLDHDDELSEHALFHVAAEVNRAPDCAMIYSDEDMIDADGRRYDGKFKPDWSADFFHEVNLATHLIVYRTDVLQRVNGFRIGLEGSQDYDLALRVTEQIEPSQIRHIPHILYHWRAIPGSVAFAPDEKNYAHGKARQALREHFARTGNAAESIDGFQNMHRARYFLPENPPIVSLILVDERKNNFVHETIENLLTKTDYPNFEIILVGALEINDSRIRILQREFDNFAASYSFAAEQANGEILCFLDASARAINSDWLTELSSQAARPEIGAVGAKLLYSDGLIRHGGIILGIDGLCGNAHELWTADEAGYYLRAALCGNFSAVSGACLAVRREIFEQIGGFDAASFPNGLFDVDFCLRANAANFQTLWTPYAKLFQLADSASERIYFSAKRRRDSLEALNFRRKYGKLLNSDQFYNQNLSLENGDFRFAPPRSPRIWEQ